MKHSHRGDRPPHPHDARGPRWIIRPENYGSHAGAGAGDYPVAPPGIARGFRGHGPSQAAPSDDEVLDRICERLAAGSDVDASEIEVSVQAGFVVLAGTVPSRQAKRDAAAIAESARGAREVENRLRVRGKDTSVY